MYSQHKLRRAERKLIRERAGLNRRADRRMNRKFFSQKGLPLNGPNGGIVAMTAVSKTVVATETEVVAAEFQWQYS